MQVELIRYCYYFNWSEGQLSVFLCKGSKNYSEILHEVRGSEGSKNDGDNFFREINYRKNDA